MHTGAKDQWVPGHVLSCTAPGFVQKAFSLELGNVPPMAWPCTRTAFYCRMNSNDIGAVTPAIHPPTCSLSLLLKLARAEREVWKLETWDAVSEGARMLRTTMLTMNMTDLTVLLRQ